MKTLEYRQRRTCSGVYEEWNYIDAITSASTYYDEDIKMTVVRCTFRDGGQATIAVPCVAYLMSDAGKTVEKILGATVEEIGDVDPIYNAVPHAD